MSVPFCPALCLVSAALREPPHSASAFPDLNYIDGMRLQRHAHAAGKQPEILFLYRYACMADIIIGIL
jgi:hypothetical protein